MAEARTKLAGRWLWSWRVALPYDFARVNTITRPLACAGSNTRTDFSIASTPAHAQVCTRRRCPSAHWLDDVSPRGRERFDHRFEHRSVAPVENVGRRSVVPFAHEDAARIVALLGPKLVERDHGLTWPVALG